MTEEQEWDDGYARVLLGGEGAGWVEDFDPGWAIQSVVQEFGRAASFHVGDDAGVEGDGTARAYSGTPLSFPKPEMVGELCAGLRVPDVSQYDAPGAPVSASQYGGEARAAACDAFKGFSVSPGSSESSQ